MNIAVPEMPCPSLLPSEQASLLPGAGAQLWTDVTQESADAEPTQGLVP